MMIQKVFSVFIFLMFTFGVFAQAGLKGEYFNGANFEQRMATRIDSKIDFAWEMVSPVPNVQAENFSIRWTGRVLAPSSGTYLFSGVVDDGLRVKVGGVMVINNWGLNDNQPVSGYVKMEKGKYYDIQVEYFNGPREGEVRLKWAMPNEAGTGRKPAAVIESKYFVQVPAAVIPAPPKPPVKPAPPKPPVKPVPKPAPKPTVVAVSKDTIQKYTPTNVMFEKSTNKILASSFAELDRLAAMLQKYPSLKLRIEGHTDLIGDAALNMKLSTERATTVADYLVSKGIAQDRITAIGYGSTRPLVKDSNPKNRRVEFIVF